MDWTVVMRSVLIAGCAGFIGGNLVEACLRKGWEVIGVDNLSTGHMEVASPDRYKKLSGNYTFVKSDINDTEKMVELLQGVDTCFLLAALPRVSYSIDKPIKANHANITGTLSMLEACRRSNVGRVVFSCSSSIYGGVAEFPTPETAPAMPKSPYALHKLVGAEYMRLYSELHGLDTVSLLYFNVFGPLQRTGENSAYATVIPAFFDAARKGESCRIDGRGDQVRDFCYVTNVVQANILAAEYPQQFRGDRFNIANGQCFSVQMGYNTVKKWIDDNLKCHYAPARLGDPAKSHADISKAREVLGYDPKVDFYRGMELTAKWWLAGCPIGIKE